jgi:hypothetical protein
MMVKMDSKEEVEKIIFVPGTTCPEARIVGA